MPTEAPIWRRKKYLIHPRFQITVASINLLCGFLGFGGVYFVFQDFIREMLDLGREAGFHPDHAYFHFLNFQFGSLGIRLAFVFVLAVICSSILSVWISHRAVGPIMKLTEYLRRLRKLPPGAEPPHLQFRRNDLFRELPELVIETLKAEREGAGRGGAH